MNPQTKKVLSHHNPDVIEDKSARTSHIETARISKIESCKITSKQRSPKIDVQKQSINGLKQKETIRNPTQHPNEPSTANIKTPLNNIINEKPSINGIYIIYKCR